VNTKSLRLSSAVFVVVLAIGSASIAGAQTAARGRAAAPAPASAAGIKVGDTVSISTAFGWVDGKVVSFNGDNYTVQAQTGATVMKTYPAELRRIGPPTAYDRSRGVYEVGDKVQVNDGGKWIDSKIITTLGMEYQVELPGNKTAWAKPELLRLVTPAPSKAAPASTAAAASGSTGAAKPPKPGLASCAGKIEGRYAASNGLPYTMEFRSGKVTIKAPLMGDEQAECWTGGGKIVLHKPGEPDDIEMDINDDGTLQTPFGEMKKRGS